MEGVVLIAAWGERGVATLGIQVKNQIRARLGGSCRRSAVSSSVGGKRRGQWGHRARWMKLSCPLHLARSEHLNLIIFWGSLLKSMQRINGGTHRISGLDSYAYFSSAQCSKLTWRQMRLRNRSWRLKKEGSAPSWPLKIAPPPQKKKKSWFFCFVTFRNFPQVTATSSATKTSFV